MNWKLCAGLWGTAFYTSMYFCYPDPLRTREIVAATLILACTLTSVAAKSRPRPEQWLK